VWREDGTTPQAYVRGLRCYKDWLCAAFMRHEGAKNLREYCEIPETVVDKNAKFGFKTYLYKNSDEKFNFEFEKQQEKDDDKIQSFVDIDKIYEMLEYEYPQKERCMLPVKLSVSEIKRMHLDESEYVPLIDPLRNFNMSELKEISGAEKGTIVHFVMQMIKPQDIKDHKDVERLVEKLKEEGIVTIRQAEAVDCKKIADFFLSPLGERLKNAVRCEREFSFYTYVTADEIYKNGQNDKILLQGIMDCFFVEKDGRTVLLDFKTDRAENRDKAIMIAKKYRLQMKYYKKALTEILERAVDECYLYFLDCGELVSMNEED